MNFVKIQDYVVNLRNVNYARESGGSTLIYMIDDKCLIIRGQNLSQVTVALQGIRTHV